MEWNGSACVPLSSSIPGCSDEHSEGEAATDWTFSGGTSYQPMSLSVGTSNLSGTSSGTGVVSNPQLDLSNCDLGECAVTRYYWHCGADTDYQWEKKKETNCEPKPSETKPCEDKGNRKASGNQTATYTCGSNGWTLSGWDSSACRYSCDPATKPQEDPKKTMKCNYCGESVIQYECEEKTGTWKEIGGPCSKTQQECGYLCGTAQAECTPGKNDYYSGKSCPIGKGHPDQYVTRYGNDCTLSTGYVCRSKTDNSSFATGFDDGTSNSQRACECPSVWWSGRYCDERCRWVNEACPSSGGGGGGGGREGSGCTTSLTVYSYYRDATGMLHETWAYKTTCE